MLPGALPVAGAAKRLSPLNRAFHLDRVLIVRGLRLGHAPGAAAALAELVGVIPKPEMNLGASVGHAEASLSDEPLLLKTTT